MSAHAAPEKPGNFAHFVVGCDCGRCSGTWDLGILDYWHPSAVRMAWWRWVGKPLAKHRVNVWNRHQADPQTAAALAERHPTV